MIVYRQLLGSDVWHYMRTCQHWPKDGYEYFNETSKVTSGELCNECKAKSRKEKRKHEISNRT